MQNKPKVFIGIRRFHKNTLYFEKVNLLVGNVVNHQGLVEANLYSTSARRYYHRNGAITPYVYRNFYE
jgi:hypothetical protein